MGTMQRWCMRDAGQHWLMTKTHHTLSARLCGLHKPCVPALRGLSMLPGAVPVLRPRNVVPAGFRT